MVRRAWNPIRNEVRSHTWRKEEVFYWSEVRTIFMVDASGGENNFLLEK